MEVVYEAGGGVVAAGGMQKKLASLRERIGQNAVVQEGEQVHEDPNKLLKKAVEVLGELERLVFAINRGKLADERSLT